MSHEKSNKDMSKYGQDLHFAMIIDIKPSSDNGLTVDWRREGPELYISAQVH